MSNPINEIYDEADLQTGEIFSKRLEALEKINAQKLVEGELIVVKRVDPSSGKEYTHLEPVCDKFKAPCTHHIDAAVYLSKTNPNCKCSDYCLHNLDHVYNQLCNRSQ